MNIAQRPFKMKSTYLPFGLKLMSILCIMVLFPSAAIGFVSYHSSLSALENKTKLVVSSSLDQIANLTNLQIDNIDKLGGDLFYDIQMQRILTMNLQPYESYQTTELFLNPKLQSLLNSSQLNVNLSLYVDNNSVHEVFSQSSDFNPAVDGSRFEVFHFNRLLAQPWYTEVKSSLNPLKGYWVQVGQDKALGNISYVRPLVDFQSLKTKGLVRIVVNLRQLLNLIVKNNQGQTLAIEVTNSQGGTLLTAGEIHGITKRALLANYLTIRKELKNGWIIYAYVPVADLEKSALTVRNVTIYVGLCSVLILIFLSILISQYFSKRMNKIVASINRFKPGEHYKPIYFKGNDEFKIIAAAFNALADDLNQRIQEVYITGLQKKDAELKALQSQINPHFLYNTLSAINKLARMGDSHKMEQMISGLGKFYRLSLNKGKFVISVQKELELIQAYVDIQKIKHGNRLEVYFHIDSDVLTCKTIKLLLQPFVENSIRHALFGDRLNLVVDVSKMGQEIWFKVIDDGVGFWPRGVEPKHGYGIQNVNNRLRLYYGDEYHVRFNSIPGAGTAVLIRIPILHDYKEED